MEIENVASFAGDFKRGTVDLPANVPLGENNYAVRTVQMSS
jgi:hypothetical protein